MRISIIKTLLPLPIVQVSLTPVGGGAASPFSLGNRSGGGPISGWLGTPISDSGSGNNRDLSCDNLKTNIEWL